MSIILEKRKPVGDAVLLDWEAPSLTYDIIFSFMKAGFNNPIVFGGFLRDNYLGQLYRDIDVIVSCPRLGQEQVSRMFEQVGFSNAVRSKGIYFGDWAGQSWSGDFNHPEYERIPMDIKVTRRPMTVRETVQYGDAPINRIAAGALGQEFHVMADPQFEADAMDGVYNILRDHDRAEVKSSERRFRDLRQRMPGLQLFHDGVCRL